MAYDSRPAGGEPSHPRPTMKTIKRLAAAIPLTIALLAGLGVAPAHARVYRTFTSISWWGQPCVAVDAPVLGNTTLCPGSGFFQINETVVQSGQWIGVRIPLAGQTHVECAVWLGPDGGMQSIYAHDSADASLGAGEADCLRQVP